MYRYKVQFRPELQHRRRADRERTFQYSCRERMLEKPVHSTVSRPVGIEKRKCNYPFYRTMSALRSYYFIQQVLYSAGKIGWIQGAMSCVANVFTYIAEMRVYALVSPLVSIIDIVCSAVIRGPMKVAPSCRSVSIKEVRNTTLLPVSILLKPFTHMGRLKVQRQPATFSRKLNMDLVPQQQNIVQHSCVRVAVIFNFFIYVLLSLLNLTTSCLLLCIPYARSERPASMATNTSITYNSSMTFHTPEQVVSIKWSYDISVKPNHLMNFNLCPPYSLKPPEGTYVKV